MQQTHTLAKLWIYFTKKFMYPEITQLYFRLIFGLTAAQNKYYSMNLCGSILFLCAKSELIHI